MTWDYVCLRGARRGWFCDNGTWCGHGLVWDIIPCATRCLLSMTSLLDFILQQCPLQGLGPMQRCLWNEPGSCPQRSAPGMMGCTYLKILPLCQQPEPLIESVFTRALLLAHDLGGSIHTSVVQGLIKQHQNNSNSRLRPEDKVITAMNPATIPCMAPYNPCECPCLSPGTLHPC